MSSKVQDKTGDQIKEGDTVVTRSRGGVREGEADKIVTSEKDAKQEDVKNPPKVIYEDQHEHRLAHNPETLRKE